MRAIPRRMHRWAGGAMGLALVGVTLQPATAQQEEAMALTLKSSAFRDGERIPKPHTCEGNDISPPLTWTDPPPGTNRFALIVDDPDAPVGTWVHWVLYNLPADARDLPEQVGTEPELADGALQGMNDFQRVGYGGPCPPPGPPHRYVFKLYAVDGPLTLPPKSTKAQLEQAMEGHILAQAQLIGLYQR